jgi:threonine/homoserine/homoserine lactone efflux protein
MDPALYAGFFLFAVVSTITPGPNNLMLMASGAVHGLKGTAPHMAGVVLGFGAMTFAVGLGVTGVFKVAPWLYAVLRWGAAAYLLYIAYRMATAKGSGSGKTAAKPVTFLGAVGFQWINPKAWVMALGAVTTYAEQGRLLEDVTLIAGTYVLVNIPTSLIWTSFGVNIRRWLKSPRRLKAFNWTMAALLVASLYPLLTEPLGPKAASAKAPAPASSPAR